MGYAAFLLSLQDDMPVDQHCHHHYSVGCIMLYYISSSREHTINLFRIIISIL